MTMIEVQQLIDSKKGRFDDDPLGQAALWRDQGVGVALVTVVRSWDPARQALGARMALSEAGAVKGSVAPGVTDELVVYQARRMFADGEPRVLRCLPRDVPEHQAAGAGEGSLELYLELVTRSVGQPIGRRDWLDRVVAARIAGLPVVLVTDLSTGWKSLVLESVVHGCVGLTSELLDEIRPFQREGRSGMIEWDDDQRWFVELFS